MMLADYLKYSKKLAGNPAFCQGAGGNTSVKINNTLYVKSSGVLLKNLKKESGYVCCNFLPLKKFFSKPFPINSQWENKFNREALNNLDLKKSFGSPSIETGLHAIINSAYIFHTHNAYANIFNFMQGGEKLLKDIFTSEEILVIGYHSPGIGLARELYKKQSQIKKLPAVIFLKNHGLITHGKSAKEAYDLTLLVTNKIKAYLKTHDQNKAFQVNRKPVTFKHHLFPDSAVFSQINFNTLPKEKKQIYFEICSVVNFTLNSIKKLGGIPQYLKKSEINYIQNMDKEKMRIKMLHND